jgi:hypothetical protein
MRGSGLNAGVDIDVPNDLRNYQARARRPKPLGQLGAIQRRPPEPAGVSAEPTSCILEVKPWWFCAE